MSLTLLTSCALSPSSFPFLFSSFLFFSMFCPHSTKERGMSHDYHFTPCLHCHPRSFIRTVQHLIERCLILRMSCYDCVEALARHARIRPLVTLTVWRELLKENRAFFQAYYQAILPRPITYKPIQRVSRFRRRKPWK